LGDSGKERRILYCPKIESKKHYKIEAVLKKCPANIFPLKISKFFYFKIPYKQVLFVIY